MSDIHSMQEACTILQMNAAELSEESLEKAAKKARFKAHPDNKAQGGEGSTEAFKAVQDAYDFLKKHLKNNTDGSYVAATQRGEFELLLTVENLWQGVNSRIPVDGRNYRFEVPPRVPEGTLLRVACGRQQVLVRVRVIPHKIWDVKGEHLGLEVEVPESKKDISFSVPLPDKSIKTITVGPELKSGMLHEVPGYGQSVDGGLDGSLFVRVRRV